MSMWRYVGWCLMEISICCAFTAMYLVLMAHGHDGYFSWLGRCISGIGSVLVFPYAIITLLICYLDALHAEPMDDQARLKFYDSRHQLKFITSAASVQYIESNENYIIIHYMENGVSKRFQLRNSMKNIEPLCEKAGFARAHRCYILNPKHVKLVRKDPGGSNIAEIEGVEDGIPVSKKYYENIAAIL